MKAGWGRDMVREVWRRVSIQPRNHSKGEMIYEKGGFGIGKQAVVRELPVVRN